MKNEFFFLHLQRKSPIEELEITAIGYSSGASTIRRDKLGVAHSYWSANE